MNERKEKAKTWIKEHKRIIIGGALTTVTIIVGAGILHKKFGNVPALISHANFATEGGCSTIASMTVTDKNYTLKELGKIGESYAERFPKTGLDTNVTGMIIFSKEKNFK